MADRTITRAEAAALLEEISDHLRLGYRDVVERKPAAIPADLREKFAQMAEAWWRQTRTWGDSAEAMHPAHVDRIRQVLILISVYEQADSMRGVLTARLSPRLTEIAMGPPLRLAGASADDDSGGGGIGVAIAIGAAALLLAAGLGARLR